MEEDTAVHEEKGLLGEVKVGEVVLHNVEHDQNDVPKKEAKQVEEVKTTSPSKVEKQADSSLDSDTQIEENEDAMLPEDGVLLTYVVKASQKEQGKEKESATIEGDTHCRDSMTMPQTVSDKCDSEIKENSLKHVKSYEA